MKITKCFLATLILSALLVLSGCMGDAVDQAKYKIDKVFSGITGSAIEAAIEMEKYNCVVIDIHAYSSGHQQIAVSKKKLKDDESCAVPPKEDVMTSIPQPEQ